MNYNLKFKIFAFFSFILFLNVKSTAQNLPKASYITTEDGLGFRDVVALIPDNKGLIWIGTSQGVERYDGKGFTTFNNKKSADIFFPGEHVHHSGIIPMEESDLLVVADEKIYTIDLCTNNWKLMDLPDEMEGKVIQVFYSAEHTLYIIIKTDTEIMLAQYQNGIFKKLSKSQKAILNLNSIATDTIGNIWWSTPLDGIRKLNKEGVLHNTYKPDSINWYGSKLYSTPVFVDKQNRIFLFPKSVYQIWQFFPDENRIKIIADNLNSPVYYGLEDQLGNLWFAGKSQALRYSFLNRDTPVMTDFTEHISRGLNYTQINSICEDKSNILWISTNNGIIKLPLGQQLIDNYLVLNDKEWGNEMRGIFETNDGSIYGYCENGSPGLYKINIQTGLHEKVRIKYSGEQTFDILVNAKHFIYDKKNNKAYFLTDHLFSIDMDNYRTKMEEDFSHITEKFSRNPIVMLHDGGIIVGSTLSKITLYDWNGEKSRRLLSILNQNDEILTSCFVEDKNGLIWVGTSNGIYIINRKGQIVRHLHTGSFPALNNNNILTLYEDNKDNIWAGTFGGGINLIKHYTTYNIPILNIPNYYDHLSVDFLSKEHGLCNENVPCILQDDQGVMWMATYDGISSYAPRNKIFQTYNVSDGISNNEFNYTSAYKDSKGMLWFGGLNGLNRINPKEAKLNSQTPAIFLLSFMKYNRQRQKQERVLITENENAKAYEISPYDSWFQFDWSLPNYLRSDKNNYYIRMEGLDEAWIYNGNSSFIRYNNLPPGSYTLYVKGADSKGNRSPGQLSIPIKVLPFFYQTWWFNLLVSLGFILTIFLIYQYNLRKRMEMERMRTQIASDLHDEVGSMLSGLAMQSELLQLSEGRNVHSGLVNISDISRTIIGKMRDMVWSIDSRRDSVESLIDRMKEQIADLFQSKDISHSFEFGELPLKKQLSVNVRQQLFLIYNEAITNVIRHSDADNVHIRFGNFNGKFELSVIDNGHSNGKINHSTGLGKTNMEMRAKKIDATISFEHRNGYVVRLVMKKI
ncbi:MAG: hypothetical protein H7X99_05610 [Saprospiraceae bacterium]|nr:hypothetical protein [Saprospiraceae bacterium]